MDLNYPLESTPKRVKKDQVEPIVVESDSDSSILCYYPDCSLSPRPSPIRACDNFATFADSLTFDESADTSVLMYSPNESKNDLDSSILMYSPIATEGNDSSVLVYTPNASEEADSQVVVYSPTPSSPKDPSRQLTAASITAQEDEELSDSVKSTEITLSFSEVVQSYCCKCKCVENMSITDMRATRERFQSKTTGEQRQFLVDFLATQKVGERLSVSGVDICKKAFSMILGCSSRRIDRMISIAQKGQVRLVHGNSGCVRSSEKTDDAKAWMKVFFDSIGEHMPHTKQTHLPSFLTKGEVYQRMISEMEESGIEESGVISRSQFYSLWDLHFSHVVIPQVRKWVYFSYTSDYLHYIPMSL